MSISEETKARLIQHGCNAIYVRPCEYPNCSCSDLPVQINTALAELEKTHQITEKVPGTDLCLAPGQIWVSADDSKFLKVEAEADENFVIFETVRGYKICNSAFILHWIEVNHAKLKEN